MIAYTNSIKVFKMTTQFPRHLLPKELQDTTPEEIGKLWTTQISLHGYNTYNLIYQLEDGGLMYSTSDKFEDLVIYLNKYYAKGDLNTGGIKFKKYLNNQLKKYFEDYPGRPAYVIFVNAKGLKRGENKIMGVSEEGLEYFRFQASLMKDDPMARFLIQMMELNK